MDLDIGMSIGVRTNVLFDATYIYTPINDLELPTVLRGGLIDSNGETYLPYGKKAMCKYIFVTISTKTDKNDMFLLMRTSLAL